MFGVRGCPSFGSIFGHRNDSSLAKVDVEAGVDRFIEGTVKSSAQVIARHSHLESDIASSLISKPFGPCCLGLLSTRLKCD